MTVIHFTFALLGFIRSSVFLCCKIFMSCGVPLNYSEENSAGLDVASGRAGGDVASLGYERQLNRARNRRRTSGQGVQGSSRR